MSTQGVWHDAQTHEGHNQCVFDLIIVTRAMCSIHNYEASRNDEASRPGLGKSKIYARMQMCDCSQLDCRDKPLETMRLAYVRTCVRNK